MNEECIDVFRLDKHGINFFSERLSNHELIHRSTVAGLPPSTQFLVPLRYYATGNSINSLKDTAGLDLSHGSVENCIKSVSKALSSFLATDVSFPFDSNSFATIKQGFAELGNFPACIGAIDGTQIKIKAPSIDEESYVGKKEGHYINCQVVCDHNLKFTDAVVRWPGSTDDSTIWTHSGFRQKLDNFLQTMPESYKAWLIGDSGYAQSEMLMIPKLHPQRKADEAYNAALKTTRSTVERSIGVLKSRFRCLCKKTAGGIQYDVETCSYTIMACIVLHNYCRDRNIPQDVVPDVQKLIDEERAWQEAKARQMGYVNGNTVEGIAARRNLIASYFSK